MGAAEYEPFGHVNRVTYLADTAHPYGTTTTSIPLAYIQQPGSPDGGIQAELRPRFALIDTASPSTDYAYVSTANDVPIGSMKYGGVPPPPDAGTDWSEWVPTDGGVHVRFKSSGSGGAHQGIIMTGYEYRRHEAGAAAVWTPIRFPGQYHDAETDLFENWNRFYDPSIGRYLSPDPIFGNMPVYAYAANNPINRMDPRGLKDVADPAPGGSCSRSCDPYTGVCTNWVCTAPQLPVDFTTPARTEYVTGMSDTGPERAGGRDGARGGSKVHQCPTGNWLGAPAAFVEGTFRGFPTFVAFGAIYSCMSMASPDPQVVAVSVCVAAGKEIGPTHMFEAGVGFAVARDTASVDGFREFSYGGYASVGPVSVFAEGPPPGARELRRCVCRSCSRGH